MKISYKLILGYLLVALLASFTTLTALRSYQNIHLAFDHLIHDPLPTMKSLEELRRAGTRIVSSTSEICVIYGELETENPNKAGSETQALLHEEKELRERGYDRYDNALAVYEQTVDRTSPKELEYLETIKSRGDSLKAVSAQLISEKQKGINGEKILDLREKFENEEMAYLQANDEALANENAQMNSEMTNVQDTISYSTSTTYIVTFLTFLLAVASGIYFSRLISNRIVKLKQATENIGLGTLATVIEATSEDEIGDLGRSFNKMVRDLGRMEAEAQIISAIIQGVSTTSHLRELLSYIHCSISTLIYAENCYVALYDPKTEMLEMRLFVDKYDEASPSVKLGKGLTSCVFRSGLPLLVTSEDIQRLMESGDVELIGTPPAVWMGVPLQTPNGVIGVLVVQHYDDGDAYSMRDLELLTSIGDQIGIAIERKRTEEALQISRDYLSEIINAVGDPIFVKNRRHQWTLINDAMAEFIGHTREELLGRSDHDFFPADEADIFWEKDELVFISGEENINEEEFTDAHGNKRHIVTRKRLHKDKQGEQYIVAVINDVTARKETEKILQENIRSKEESLALLDSILATAPIGFAFYNCELVIERINDTLAATNGISVDQHLGRTLREVLPEMAVGIEPLLQQVIDTGEPVINLEMTAETGADPGNPHHWLANFYPVRTKGDEMLGVGVLVQDVTPAKKAEETLRASEARFQSAFDYAPFGIGLTTPEGNWLQANHSLCEILGYTKEELLATSFQKITYIDDLAHSLVFKEQLLSGEVKSCQFEKRYIHKLGHQVLAQTSLSLVRDTQNDPLYFISQIEDITERRSLEDKVQRGQKLESIGQLAAGIAHEINTPTQYVGDNVRFLQDSFDDFVSVLEKSEKMVDLCKSENLLQEFIPEIEGAIASADVEYMIEEVPKAFRQALDGVERIRKIVQSMKDFAHPGSNDLRSTDLNKAIESTITVASNEWKYVANLVTNYDQDLPHVPCLAGEFNQVILNMIVNAAHAISDTVGDGSNGKGTINIATRRVGDFAEIRISDTGTGIPEDIRKKIFDPFFTTKEVGRGTGQGLAISHTVIVEKHEGTIDVESEVGKGTTFVICLPVNKVNEAAAYPEDYF